MQLPIVFEEQGKLVLMRLGDLPVLGDVVVPFGEVVGILQKVILKRVVNRSGQEIEKAVRQGLVVGDETWEVCGVLKRLVRIQPGAAGGSRDGRRRRFRSFSVGKTYVHSSFERVLAGAPADRVR